jgi:hypothetical protein
MFVNSYTCTVAAADVHLHDPQTLYRHWEDEQWSPFEIELGPDAERWKRWIPAIATLCSGRSLL